MVEVEFIKQNSIFIRSGSCNRCGKCCHAYNEHPKYNIEAIKTPCNHLSYNVERTYGTCLIQDNKYQICKDNPIYPTACMVLEAVDTCGYSWVVNEKLTKIQALKMFNNLCDACHRKEPCIYYDKVINEVNEKCME